jgi:diguanylate cyclase (GGDEF)-like protein/PAS domain S-box-containing protein
LARRDKGLQAGTAGRRRAEEAPRESEEGGHTLSAASFEGIFIHEEGKILDANQGFARMFGYELPEVIGRHGCDLLAPEYRDVARHNVVTGYEGSYEAMGVRKDGSTFPLEVCGKAMSYEGQTVRVTAVRDISQGKRAEEALRENEVKYRQIFENVQDILYRTDAQGIITEISPSVERYGYTREGLIGTQVLNVYENPEERSRLLEAVFERGEVIDFEIHLKAADGRQVPTSVSTRLLRDGDGEFAGTEGILRDISERKRMEKALRESEAKYRQIFENVHDIFYRTNLEGTILELSPSIKRYGYSREALIGTSVLELYKNAEQRPKLLETLLERGEVTDYEIRLKTANGGVIDTSLSGHLLRSPDGTPIGLEGFLRDITERKRIEEALRESEEKFRRIFDNVHDIYYRTDAEGIITDISPSVRQFGYTPDELIGRQVLEIYPNPEERSALLEALFESGVVVDHEVHLKTGKGPVGVASVSSHVLRGPDGTFAGVEGSLRDITGRKEAAQALARQSALVEAMSRVFQEALSAESEEAVAQTCLAVAQELTQSKFGFVGELNQAGRFDTLALSDPGWQACGMPSSDAAAAVRNMEIRGIWGSVIKQGRSLIANDPASHPDRVGTPDGHPPITAFLGTPLKRGGKTIGMIAVANREAGYDRAEQEDLESLSAAFVEALERKRAEEALRESEARYRRVFDNIHDLFYQTDAHGIITDISPSVERYGYTREQLIGTQVLDVYDDPEERSSLLKALAEEGVAVDHEVHLKTADGHVKNTSVSAHLLRGPDGSVIGVEGSLRDISERKRMEKALRESNERYRTLVETSPDAITLTDLSTNVIMANRQAALLHGFDSVEEMLSTGMSALDFIAPEDRERAIQNAQKTLEMGTVRDAEYTVLRKDGSRFPGEITASLIADAEGSPKAFIGITRDITERKRAEEALREQVRRDPLTGTLNHAAIVEELRHLISKGAEGSPHAVAMIDVNDLKAINDTFGHPVGDEVLITVADALEAEGVLVGRYGGDEFVAILPGADREAAESYRQQVLAGLEDVNLQDPDTGARVPVAVSVGFAIYPAEAERIEDLIKLADSAMYAWRRQRPILSAVRPLSRSIGGERAAKMVGEIVPLLTSSGDLNDKLRLVAHRLSVGAGYDAVNFQLFGNPSEVPTGQNTFAKAPIEIVEAWNRAQRQTKSVPLRRILERTRRPIIVDDPQDDQRLTREQRELLRAANLRSALVAPMIWQNELIGLVSVASRRKGAFAPLDAEFLMAVAAQVTAIVRLATLVDELQSTSSRLAQGQIETVMMLAAAAEAHDQATGLHLQNVRAVTKALASDLGYSVEDANELGLVAVLHDIGKIRVPDVVLSTAGQLTDSEWELMKQHTVWGGDFLAGRQGFELAATIARSHHERWDGSGYPDGLAGEAIPKAATIVAVADAFDAMTSNRPYRAARSVAAAVREIAACSGGQFSPTVVQALVRLHKRRRLPRLRRQALGRLAA